MAAAVARADKARPTGIRGRRSVPRQHLGGDVLGRGAPACRFRRQALSNLVGNHDMQLDHTAIVTAEASDIHVRECCPMLRTLEHEAR